jgi:hypothetical protein
MVVYICNISYSGDGAVRSQFEASLGTVSKTLSQKQNENKREGAQVD